MISEVSLKVNRKIFFRFSTSMEGQRFYDLRFLYSVNSNNIL